LEKTITEEGQKLEGHKNWHGSLGNIYRTLTDKSILENFPNFVLAEKARA
jgi:hypothetical protein